MTAAGASVWTHIKYSLRFECIWKVHDVRVGEPLKEVQEASWEGVSHSKAEKGWGTKVWLKERERVSVCTSFMFVFCKPISVTCLSPPWQSTWEKQLKGRNIYFGSRFLFLVGWVHCYGPVVTQKVVSGKVRKRPMAHTDVRFLKGTPLDLLPLPCLCLL